MRRPRQVIAVLAILLGILSELAQADAHCIGPINEYVVYSDGSLTVLAPWRGDWTILCSTQGSWILRTQPVLEGERFAGMKVMPGTNSSRLAALGVQSGDVIRSVEGKLIESGAAWQRVDDALSTGSSIVVGIEREESLMSVSPDGARLLDQTQPPAGPSQSL